MVLYHGSNMIVSEPENRMTKHTKDLGWGFYTTEIRLQAEQWAYRRAAFGGEPSVSSYEYQENKDLNIKAFVGSTMNGSILLLPVERVERIHMIL